MNSETVTIVSRLGPEGGGPSAHATRGLPATRKQSLLARTVAADTRFAPIAKDQAELSLAVTGDTAATRKLAQRLLKKRQLMKMMASASQREVRQRYFAIETLARGMSGAESTDDFIAALSLVRDPESGRYAATMAELEELLQRTPESRLGETVGEILESRPELRDSLLRSLKTARHDRSALREWLRNAQDLALSIERETTEQSADQAGSEAAEQREVADERGEHRGAGARARRTAGRSATRPAAVSGDTFRIPIDETFLATLQDEARQMYGDHQSLIDASVNTAPALEQFEEPNRALEAFYEIVTQSTGFADTCRSLLSRFSFDKMESVIATITRALGDDLKALHPSVDRTVLSAILQPLSQVKVFATLKDLYERFVEHLDGIARRYDLQLPALDASKLLTGLLDILDGSWVAAHKFESLLRTLGIHGESETVAVMQRIHELLRLLPDTAFSGEDRLAVRAASQEALNAAIRREEELDFLTPTK